MKKTQSIGLIKSVLSILFLTVSTAQAASTTYSIPISFAVNPGVSLQTVGPSTSGSSDIPFTFSVAGPNVIGTLFSISVNITSISQANIAQTGPNPNSEVASYSIYQQLNLTMPVASTGINDPWNSANIGIFGNYSSTLSHSGGINGYHQYYNGPNAPSNVILNGSTNYVFTGDVNTQASINSASNVNLASLDLGNVVLSGTMSFVVIDAIDPPAAVPLPSALSMIGGPLAGLILTGLRRRSRDSSYS